MDFYQVCVLVAVVAFVVLVVFAVRTFLQITRTAEAVEYLAVSTADEGGRRFGQALPQPLVRVAF